MNRRAQRDIARLRLHRAERRITLAIQRALARQQAVALERTLSLTAAVRRPPVDPFGEDSWDTAIEEEVVPVVESVLAGVAGSALASLLSSFASSGKPAPSLPAPDVRPAMATIIEQVRGIAPVASERLNATLGQMVAEGASVYDMASAVRDSFDITGRAAERLVRTETARTVNAANRDAMRPAADAGIVARRQWLATDDELVRPTHDEADGQIISWDGQYAVGDDFLDYPGDPSGSPEETINCRCVELFLEPDDETGATDPEEEGGDDEAE